jgi:hypothetical protein
MPKRAASDGSVLGLPCKFSKCCFRSLWTRRFPKEGRDGDEQAAYAVAAWLHRADRNDSLGSYFNPPLTPEERGVAISVDEAT